MGSLSQNVLNNEQKRKKVLGRKLQPNSERKITRKQKLTISISIIRTKKKCLAIRRKLRLAFDNPLAKAWLLLYEVS